MPSGSSRLWRASPLTYLGIVIAALLSIYPFYYMFIIATRSLDAINDTPPPFTPASAFGGYPTSHGCVGMPLAAARFFWNFASVGTPVTVHY